jgi:predicted DsbA family dithiol-disulfide isomerase
MSKISIEVFLSVPPCSGGVAVKRLLKRAQEEFGERIEVVIHTGRDAKWQEYNINNAPAMVVGDLVKFVGLAPSYECLVGALCEAGLE